MPSPAAPMFSSPDYCPIDLSHAHAATRARRGGVLIKALVGMVALAIVGGAVGLWAWGSGGSGKGEATLDLVAAETRDFEVSVTASGELRAKNQTVLRSELEKEAAIVEIVTEGTRVAKGDMLFRLNTDDLQSELDDELLQQETARADVVSAEAALQIQESENTSSLQKAQVDVDLAIIQLKKWEEGDVVEKRLELATEIEKGEREHERLKTKLERSEKLFAREFLSSDELEIDRVAFIEAESNLRTARVAKQVYETYTFEQDRKKYTSDLEQKQAELERVVRKNASELETKQSDLTNKKRQFQLRQDRVKKIQGQIEKATVRAPTDGLVVYATSLEQFGWMNNQEPLNVGSVINPNQEVIMLPDTTAMIATVKVQEALVGRVKPGLRAELTVDAAQGKRFNGVVESIGIMAQSGGWRDPNVREYEVRIDLDLGDEVHGLKPSMRTEARLVLQEVNDALAVPVQAVFSEGPNQFVYTADGSRFKQTPVRVGRRSDVYAEVIDGIAPGAKVLLREPPTGQIIKATFPEAPAGPGRGGRPGGPRGGGSGAPGADRSAAKPAEPTAEVAAKPAEVATTAAAETTDIADDAATDTDEKSTDESADDTTDDAPAN
jgi:HlyD family secretion protein